ncbi:MAG TPA: hypothetical protein VGC19_14505 [Rhodanobacter sp.]
MHALDVMRMDAFDRRAVGVDLRLDLRAGGFRGVALVGVLDPRLQPQRVRMLSTINR